jgi:hypothetical protein
VLRVWRPLLRVQPDGGDRADGPSPQAVGFLPPTLGPTLFAAVEAGPGSSSSSSAADGSGLPSLPPGPGFRAVGRASGGSGSGSGGWAADGTAMPASPVRPVGPASGSPARVFDGPVVPASPLGPGRQRSPLVLGRRMPPSSPIVSASTSGVSVGGGGYSGLPYDLSQPLSLGFGAAPDARSSSREAGGSGVGGSPLEAAGGYVPSVLAKSSDRGTTGARFHVSRPLSNPFAGGAVPPK